MTEPHHLLLLCYIDMFIYRRFVKYKAYVATNDRMDVNEGPKECARARYYLTISRVETEDNYESPNKDGQTRSRYSNPAPPELKMRILTVASLVYIWFI
jgi:hypothetical protein